MNGYGEAMTDAHKSQSDDLIVLNRRTVLVSGAAICGAGLLAACGSTDGSAGGTNPTAATTGGQAAAGGSMQVATTDVPVGGGKILDNPQVVLTQPTAGTFKAFSSICTHAGCAVADVQQGQIICPCHGSIFSATDGSVLQGPAASPLPPVTITVSGSTISISG